MWYSPRSPARDGSRRWRGRVGRRINTAEVERHAVAPLRRRDGLQGRERRIVEAAAPGPSKGSGSRRIDQGVRGIALWHSASQADTQNIATSLVGDPLLDNVNTALASF